MKIVLKIVKFLLLLAIVVVAISVIMPDVPKHVLSTLGFEKTYTIHPREDGKDYMHDPVQIKTTGGTTIRVDNLEAKLNFVAEYAVAGKVLGVENYSGRRMEDRLSPRDVALAWGWLAEKGADSNIKWGPFVYRGFLFTYYEADLKNKIRGNFSNTHLIPNNKETERLINDIREGEYVRIEGYLVNVTCDMGNGRTFTWNTATSRNNFDCEVIYVTGVTWLMGP